MPLRYKDKELFPLEVYRITNGGEVVYDRDTRGKSWFYLLYTKEGDEE